MKKFIVLSAVIVLFLAGASDIFACSCMVDAKQSTSKKIQTSYKQATVVFYGEVTEVKRGSGTGESIDPNQEPVTVKFKVERLWKGRVTSEVIVRTAGNSAMCGFNFEAGKKYLVYANDAGSGLQTNICTRTSVSSGDAKYLNKIKKPKLFAKK